MSRLFIPALVFILLVIEGTLFQLVTPSYPFVNSYIVPRFIVVIIVFIGIHFDRAHALTYGGIFGIVYDIVYTQLLGVYLFGFSLISYIFALNDKRIQDSLLIQLLMVVVALSFIEYYQYGLYRLIGFTTMTHDLFFSLRFLPSIILNSAFAIIIYYPVRTLFNYVKKQERLRERI